MRPFLILGLLFVPSAAALAGDADKSLQALLTKAANQSTDRAKLRQEVLSFRRTYVGTPAALKALELLYKLPSPLDAIDPAKLDEVERKGCPREMIAVLAGHTRMTAAVAFSPDASLLASSGWDNTIKLWKVGQAVPKEWTTLKGSPSGVAFSPDGKTLAGGSAETAVVLWDVSGAEPKHKGNLQGHKNRPFALAFSPDGKLFASGSFNPVLRVWKMDGDPEAWGVLTNENTLSLGISSLAFSANGKLLAAGSLVGESSLRLWNVSGAFLEERDIGKTKARVVALSPDGKTLAFLDDEAAIHLWDLSDAKPKALPDLPGHPVKKVTHAVLALGFSPDGRHLVSSGKDKKVIFWEMPSGKSVREWSFPAEVRALDWACDGRHLAAALEDGSVLILRLAK